MIPQLITILLLTVSPSTGFAPIDVTAKLRFSRAEVKVGEELCVVLQGPLLVQGIIGEFPLPVYHHRHCSLITPLSTGFMEMKSENVPGGVFTAWVEIWAKGKIRLKGAPLTLNYVLDCGRTRPEEGDPRCL